ncbi:MAG: glycosyltransferase family 39 protein [Saccharofermentans sp.]|nr:glycosyltransferase family 39 protein [Saccharofermentans sp.]
MTNSSNDLCKSLPRRLGVSGPALFKYAALLLILIAGFIAYVVPATHSSLWFDEVIEYYYSKYMTGYVPGGYGTSDMYERICFTFQPPLYNILMYLWLKIYDSEFWFRLAGILTILIGSVAIFAAVDEKTESGLWANIAAALYLFTPAVTFYGLECGEYNLMMCFMSWAICFFIKSVNKPSFKNMALFFVFSSLAVLSQYGAAFCVMGMYLSLLIKVLRSKKRKLILTAIILTAATAVLVVLPLLIFFVIPQMNSMGNITVSHIPSFVFNPIVDYVDGIAVCAEFIFYNSMDNMLLKALVTVFVTVATISMVIAVVQEKRKAFYLAFSLFIMYSMYYAAVITNFYGYYWWSDTTGGLNFGKRYCVFMVPILIVAAVTALHTVSKKTFEKKAVSMTASVLSMICFACLIVAGFTNLDIIRWEKSNLREAADAWYDAKAYESTTYLFRDPIYYEEAICYYIEKHDGFKEDMMDRVMTCAVTGDIAYEDYYTNYIKGDEFYFVAREYCLETSVATLKSKGYDVSVVFKDDSEDFHVAQNYIVLHAVKGRV